jgi:methylenetetrahydrofolate reductase (NADPH)
MKAGSRLEELLDKGDFVLLAHLDPPPGVGGDDFLATASGLKSYVDAVVVGDCADANVRMSALAASALLSGAGVEPVMQVNCRDRNRIAMQSDIIGAASLGIRNFICHTGLHQALGGYSSSRNVFDMDVVQQIGLLKEMRDERRFSNGSKTEGEPRWLIGADDNPFGDPIELQIMLFAKKAAAGADFFRTTPVFDVERFSEWMQRIRADKSLGSAPVIASILPLPSLKAARKTRAFPGIQIPERIEQRLGSAQDPGEEGVKIALETIAGLKGVAGVGGFNFYATGAEEMVTRILSRGGYLPRPRT